MQKALKAIWTVRGGIIPRQALPELTKQWNYTSDEFEADREATKDEVPGSEHPEKPPTIFQTKRDEAIAYWTELNDPARLNWADCQFYWV